MEKAAEFRLHALAAGHRRRVERARELMVKALAIGPAYVSVSGGKDSVALLGLAREVDPRIDAWHIDSGMETPDTLAVLKHLRADHGVRVAYPELAVDEMAEIEAALGPTWSSADWKAVLIEAPSTRLCAEYGYRVVLTGLRADESRARNMRMARFGALHTRSDGLTMACPLAWWSGLDSLAYCAAHDLPISRLYTDDGPEPPEIRRTGTILGATYAQHGRYAELRRRHPLVWRRLLDRFPSLEAYS